MEQQFNTTPQPETLAGMRLLFQDHAHLSDFIFKKCGVRVDLQTLSDMTRAGCHDANDEPVLWLRRMVEALQDEVKELAESLPWKWWRHQSADIQNVRIELIDIFHFLISAAQIAGMSGEDFIQLYYQKRKLNIDRQNIGFRDGDNKDLTV